MLKRPFGKATQAGAGVSKIFVTATATIKIMKSVEIKQLKSRLSEYLRLVRSGEPLFVTDRHEVVAELRPAHRQPSTADSLDGLLDSLADGQK